jgi:thioredoxin-related protein
VRITRSILLAAVLWLAAACGSSVPTESVKSIDNKFFVEASKGDARVQWREPIVRTLVEAQQKQKVIIMYFHLGGCHYCQLMESSTLKHPQVVKRLNDGFIPVWVNIEENLENARAVGIRTTPAVVFLMPDGTHIVTIQGGIPPGDFLQVLDLIDEYTQREMQGSSIRAFIREPEREQYQL